MKKCKGWEKDFAIITSDKRLYLEYVKNSYNSRIRRQITPIVKWAKDLNRHFSKEEIQMANKHMKRYSMSLAIMGMQIRKTVKYHFILFRIAKIKNT